MHKVALATLESAPKKTNSTGNERLVDGVTVFDDTRDVISRLGCARRRFIWTVA